MYQNSRPNKIRTLTLTSRDEKKPNCNDQRNEDQFEIRDRTEKEKAVSGEQPPSSSATVPSSKIIQNTKAANQRETR